MNDSNVGRGFLPVSNIKLVEAVTVLRRTRVRGGKQRRGDFSQECLDFIRACNEVHGGPPRVVLPHEVEFFRHLLGRKALNRFLRFTTGYKHLLDSVPELVRKAVSAAAGGQGAMAAYELSNLNGTRNAEQFPETKFYAVIKAADGIKAEAAFHKTYHSTLQLPARHRRNLIAAVKLLALDPLQTELALKALNEIPFGQTL